MKKFLIGFLAATIFSWAVIPVIVIPASVEITRKAVERAAECIAGSAITGPANLLINGVEMSVGVGDTAFDAGGYLLDLGGGLFGIGGDDGYKWKEEQLHIASTFLSVGLTYVHHPDPEQRIGERELISILAAGLVESELSNLTHGDASSVGALQLLALNGSFEERMDLTYQANWYFSEMNRLPGTRNQDDRDRITIGEIAALVQRPFEEYEYRYDTRVEEATALYGALSPSLSGSLAIIGSTTTVGYQDQLVDYVRDAGWQTVLFDAEVGRTVKDSTELVARWWFTEEPTLWVFDLGEEDLGDITSVAEANEVIDLLDDILPDEANQVWVTIEDPDSAADELFNEALAIRDARTDNFTVVQWSDYATPRQEEFRPNGVLTRDAREQRAAMIGRVAIDPISFGFDESEIGGGGGFSLKLPGACEVGESVIGAAKTAVGTIFDPLGSATSFVGWVWDQNGSEVPDDTTELLDLAEEVDVTEIQPGDLIVFPDANNPLEDGEIAIYLGGSEMIREPDVGEVVYVERVDWTQQFTVHRLEIEVEIDSDIDPIGYSETVLSEGGFRVHPELRDPLSRLIRQAREDGINLGGGAWRSSESQIELRRAHCGSSDYAVYEMPSTDCNPPTARPGSSMHERGLAVDFTCDGVIITSQDNRCFVWLAANALRIAGLQNLELEPWHWSTNGR